jgi:hypothetical protein
MAVYSVEGKLGTGKTKFCVWRARTALREGRRVASNVDLRLGELVPELPNATYLRIPDKPRSVDLDSIGHGNPDSYDEEKNGILILDELGSWLNSRAFQDKDRLPVIDWLIHARKLGWDVFLIVQDAQMIDRQVREALIEYQCKCMRLDKVKVPGVGWLLGIFNAKWGYLPRMHYVTARVGMGASAIVAERWHYRGDDLHSAYDTRQIFKASEDGTICVWHPKRYTGLEARKGSFLARLFGAKGKEPPKPKTALKPAHPILHIVKKLPPDERVKHIRRLIQAGII